MPKSILTLNQYLDVASRVMAACCASARQPLTLDKLNSFCGGIARIRDGLDRYFNAYGNYVLVVQAALRPTA
jgi:hypothetical protein